MKSRSATRGCFVAMFVTLAVVTAPFLPLTATLAQGPQQFTPNDPAIDLQFLGNYQMLEAWYVEQSLVPLKPEVDVLIGGFKTDCATEPDLAPNCLPNLAVDFTGTASNEFNLLDGRQMAGLVAAVVNNAQKIVGLAGLSRRIKVIPDVVRNQNTILGFDGMRQFLQHAITLHDQGHPVDIAVWFSTGGIDDNLLATVSLLKQMEQRKITLVANAGAESRNLDLPENSNRFPVSYLPFVGNVFPVAASDGNHLISWSNYGSTKVALAAQGQDVPLLAPPGSDPDQLSRGTSSFYSTLQAAALLALVRLYKTSDQGLAMELLKKTAEPIQGVAYGIPNAYRALSFGSSSGGLLQLVLRDDSSGKLVAFDSVRMTAEPFTVLIDSSMNPDSHRRITFLATNLQTGDNSSIQVKASFAGTPYPLPVEAVNVVPDFFGFLQVTVRLPDGLPSGTFTVTIQQTLGQEVRVSNSGTINVP